MPLTDLSLAELQEYVPVLERPDDLEEFWSGTLSDVTADPIELKIEPITTHLMTLRHYDVSFAGYGGARIKAWLVRPAGVDGDLPW